MKLPPRASLLAAGCAAAVAFVFAFHRISDPDVWWHLATGRWILANGRVPTADPFSFATAGSPWVPHSWLTAVGMTVLYAKFGAAGIVIAKAAVVAAAFGMVVLLAARGGVAPWLAAVASVAAIPVTQDAFQERPHVLMLLLVPAFYWALSRPGAERRGITWASLLTLMLVWVNAHGSFFFGVALAGLLAVERIGSVVVARIRREAGDVRGALLASGLTVALAVSSFATPFGLALPRIVLHDFVAHAVTRASNIQEFEPIVWSGWLGFAALALATAASFVAAWRPPRFYALATFVVFTWMAARSVRFVGVAGIVDAGLLAWNLQAVADRLGSRLPRVRGAPIAIAASLAMATFAAVSFRSAFAQGRELRFGVGVNEERFPGAAVRYLADAGFAGNLMNTWELGGYVLWHLPAARPFVDGRSLPAQLDLIDRMQRMDPAALERWLSEHDVKGALLMRQDPMARFFAGLPGFRRAFFDDRAVVFVRAGAAPSAEAAPHYRFIRPEEFDPSYLVAIASGRDASAAEDELRRTVAATPEAFQPRFLLGYFLEARGQPEALEHYLAAARASPGLAFGHYDLGVRAGRVALDTGRIREVEPMLRQALSVVGGESPELLALLATALSAQGRRAEAEPLFRRALAMGPDVEIALTNLGFLYVETGRAPMAVPLFEQACRVAPRSDDAAYGLGVALEAAGDAAGATRAFRSLLSRFPASGWASKARARLASGR